jgi:hypothetical protein
MASERNDSDVLLALVGGLVFGAAVTAVVASRMRPTPPPSRQPPPTLQPTPSVLNEAARAASESVRLARARLDAARLVFAQGGNPMSMVASGWMSLGSSSGRLFHAEGPRSQLDAIGAEWSALWTELNAFTGTVASRQMR